MSIKSFNILPNICMLGLFFVHPKKVGNLLSKVLAQEFSFLFSRYSGGTIDGPLAERSHYHIHKQSVPHRAIGGVRGPVGTSSCGCQGATSGTP